MVADLATEVEGRAAGRGPSVRLLGHGFGSSLIPCSKAPELGTILPI